MVSITTVGDFESICKKALKLGSSAYQINYFFNISEYDLHKLSSVGCNISEMFPGTDVPVLSLLPVLAGLEKVVVLI